MKLMRPTAKKHAEIVDGLQGSISSLKRACDRWEEGWKDAKADHAVEIEALKADIKKNGTANCKAWELVDEGRKKFEDLERIYKATCDALTHACFELLSYQSLLKTMVHESAGRQLKAEKLGNRVADKLVEVKP